MSGETIDPRRFLGIFLEEAAEHAGTIERGLLQIEGDGPQDPEMLAEVFRAAHSIKGGSGIVGLLEIGKLTHAMENLFDRLRMGVRVPTRRLMSTLFEATDLLRALIAAAHAGTAGPDVGPVVDRLHAVEGATVETTAFGPVPRELVVRFEPDPAIFEKGLDPLLLLRDLAAEGEILEVVVEDGKLPRLAELDPDRCYIAWTVRLRTARTKDELLAIFEFAGADSVVSVAPPSAQPIPRAASEAKAPAPPAPAAHESSSIRVAIDKLDRLIDLVGEIVIAQSMITQTLNGFTPEKLTDLQAEIGAMERTTRELQERVMAIRMVPVSTVFQRFPRVARDTAAALDKRVTVLIHGGETEIDKSVIDRISDPLTHLVRNSVDHGIESPDERVRAGKPEQGTLTLSAAHRGGNVVIVVEDDGRGLDFERIRAKAVAQGLLTPEARPSREELTAVLFRPGFSTATVVSDISGRGVGMDVVKTNIESLGGSITMDSEPGRGTRVRVSLPLTLAIIDGLCVGLGEEVYVLPLLSIVESLRPRPEDVRKLAGRREVVLLRGEPLPLLRLRDLFRVSQRRAPQDLGFVVIVESDGAKLALHVDEILGQAQVVIKSLDANYRRIDGVMGATILGDGRVGLILDVPGLMRLSPDAGRTPAPARAAV